MSNFWEISNWEEWDPHLKKLKSMPFRRKYPFIPDQIGLHMIRGPRQIGKSSWLKEILSHYAPLKKCFYLSCENVVDHKELAEILASIRDRQVVLLDEISFVKDWDRAIKHEVDSGLQSILVITGSHAHDLKRGADQMPGRFEGGGEFELLPMLFEEFHQIRKNIGWASEDLQKEYSAYFKIGGFPSAVAEAGKENKAPIEAMKTYWKWLKGDALKLGKQEELLKEIMIQIAQCMQSPISFQTLAKKTSIASHSTVQDYIHVLNSCFAVKQLNAVDIDTGAFRFRKDKKFYFTDPLLFWIAIDLSGRTPQSQSEEMIAELVAHEFLSRKFHRFGYFSNAHGEIDFILPQEWAIELKWADYAKNLSRAYLSLNLLNKKVWTKQNFLKLD
jgi:predicted AAA+ superfamily ATPase